MKPSSRAPPSLAAVREALDRKRAERQRQDVAANADAIRARCKTFYGFVKEAWHVLEPNNRFVDGWVIEAICDHLEAVSDGRITRLLINVPPGMMKSLLVSVMWPAWEWGVLNRPSLRYVSTAHDQDLAIRDTRRMRALVQSEWYRSLFPNVGKLVRAAEDNFENEHTGWRQSAPFGSLTGKRGDRLTIDDPHSTKMAESDAQRRETERVFREDVPSRINDSMLSAIVIIMQRIHVGDVSALAKAQNYVHLCLPMEFEAAARCSTLIGFTDPRTEEGALLFPERFPREAIDRDKAQMLAHAVAGQFQQRPVPREGGLFKRAWFDERIIAAAPADCTWWRHWDLAASLKKPGAQNQAWTAGVKMGWSPSTKRYYVGHVVRVQEEGHNVRMTIRAQAEADGRSVRISLPKDPGQAGKVQATDFVAGLAGFVVMAQPETGDKYSRAEPFAAQCQAGTVYLVRGEWNTAYLDELCMFPSAAVKDQVDASSGAFGRLAQNTAAPIVAPIVVSMARRRFP